MENPLVSIIMGSESDMAVMNQAAEILRDFYVPFEIKIVSAHRTPKAMFSFAEIAHERGIEVIIAGAGGAAHLPGMVAAISPLPVIGVPIKSSNSLDGWDSILSILQMPGGVPVATVALNGAKNAGLLAIQMLSVGKKEYRGRMIEYKASFNK
jgi:5-(carboxyamino)imidazole ribonucleotide mutase